eukprot:1158513-Pelagomonas_calceolata.AAC.7
MTHAKNRELREIMYRANITRASSGDIDNTPIIEKASQCRQTHSWVGPRICALFAHVFVVSKATAMHVAQFVCLLLAWKAAYTTALELLEIRQIRGPVELWDALMCSGTCMHFTTRQVDSVAPQLACFWKSSLSCPGLPFALKPQPAPASSQTRAWANVPSPRTNDMCIQNFRGKRPTLLTTAHTAPIIQQQFLAADSPAALSYRAHSLLRAEA